jgi:hypothetical protein
MIEFENEGPRVVTLEDVINKPSWDSHDVDFLVAMKDVLPPEVLQKLGITVEADRTEDDIQKEIEAITKKKK